LSDIGIILPILQSFSHGKFGVGLCDYACLKTRYAVRRRILRYGGVPRSLCAWRGVVKWGSTFSLNTQVMRSILAATSSQNDVLDMPRGPLTLSNDHVAPTAHNETPGSYLPAAGYLEIIALPSTQGYLNEPTRYVSDVSRVFWDCGSGSGGGTRGVTGFRTLFRKRIYNTVPKRIETPENRRYAVLRRSTHYA
jgi:hypothetical protein